MGKKYKNSPLVEALCEFQFLYDQQWDWTIPGILYEKVKDSFPKKRQISLPALSSEKNNISQPIIPVPPVVHFLSANENTLLQIGPEHLVINMLKPYTSWENFKALILKNLYIYKEIANPKGFRKIGLRYINILEFDKSDIKLRDYLNYHPTAPEQLLLKPHSFFSRLEIPYENDLLILTSGTITPQKTVSLSITLDIDHVMMLPETITFDEVSSWLDSAHTRIEDVFELCITDKARELFEEVK